MKAVEWVPDALLVTDADGLIVLANAEVQRIFGYGPEELVGQAVEILLPERFGPAHSDLCARDDSDPTRRSMNRRTELSARRKDGSMFLVETSLSSISMDDAEFVVAALRDATEGEATALERDQLTRDMRLLLDSTVGGLYGMDAQGRCTFINRAGAELLGYGPYDLIGRDILDLIHRTSKAPSSSPAGVCPLMRVFQTGQVYRENNGITWRRDGTSFVAGYTAAPLREGNAIVGVVVSFTDITERKQLENLQTAQVEVSSALTESRTIGEAAPRILQAICQSTGWALGELWHLDEPHQVLHYVTAWVTPKIKVDEFLAMSRDLTFSRGVGLPGRIWATGKPAWIDNVTVDANFPRARMAARGGLHGACGFPIFVGDVVWGVFEFFSHRIRQPEDELLKVMTDVGLKIGQFIRRTEAQAHLKRAKDHAERSVQEKAAILAAANIFFISVNQVGAVTEWTSAAVRLLGIAYAEAIDQPFTQLPIGWDWTSITAAMDECRRTQQGMELPKMVLRQRDGSELVLRVKIAGIADDGGASLVVMGEDITERLRLEREREQAQKLESLGQLAAGIAHEINTPTQYIGDNTRFLSDSFTELLPFIRRTNARLTENHSGSPTAETTEPPKAVEPSPDLDYLMEEVPKAIAQTLEGVERVTKIVRAMKEFAHPDSGATAPADLNKAIQSTVTVARSEWKYVADLVLDLAPDLPTVPCQLGGINQTILNLIVNAAHAIAEKVGKSGEKGTIMVSTRRVDSWAEIRISDTGAGIPEAIRSRIFDPFFTTKEVGKGTGQGLAIARTVIIEKHGGALTFESEPGKGTTFVIRLPITAPSADQPGRPVFQDIAPAAT